VSVLRQARGANLDLFLLADPLHFDDPLHLPTASPDAANPRAREYEIALPEAWASATGREWRTAFPPSWDGPAQGWKIHVAAVPRTAQRVLDVAAAHCVAHGIAFKYLRSELVLLVCGAKYAARGSSGKFVTIYPRDETELFATLDALEERIGGLDGPAILSDIRWREGPLHVRYGAFVERWCEDEEGRRVHAIAAPDGTLVPDRRHPYVVIPEWVEVPDRLRIAEQGTAELAACGYVFEEALHFSNAGGVYRGRRVSDGLAVVLKEARPHAGLDGFATDAVTRLERERRAHEALAGIEGVPELIDRMHLGGHAFLVSAHVDAETLQRWVARRHPGVRAGFPEDRVAVERYAREALAILGRLTGIVHALHGRGWVHGDLHPANVLIDAAGRLSIVDFELAARAGARVPVGLGCPGFARPRRHRDEPVAEHDDHYAVGALALWLFLPIAIVLSADPTRAREHAAWAQEHFALPPEWRDLVERAYGPLSSPAALVRVTPTALVRAIRASSTPDRSDRLFPGDVLQYLENGRQFAAGAAGVLWSLRRIGERVPQAWIDWLSRAAGDVGEAGLLDGRAGIAVALAACGRAERAISLLDAAAEELSASTDATLYSGRAGIGLALLDAGGAGRERAVLLAEGILDARVPAAATSTGQAAGLIDGWSGVAVFLAALAAATGDERYLDDAQRCIERDLRACAAGPDGALLVEERGILYPYLAHGSAGIAVAAARLATAGRCVLSEEQLRGLVTALSPAIVIEPGVFDGRAGMILALDELDRAGLADTRALVRMHVRAFDAYAITYRDGFAVLGRGLSRVSMDYATGTAGVAAVLSSVETGRGAFPLLDAVAPVMTRRDTAPRARG